jgi:anti-sigma B factor antagonist
MSTPTGSPSRNSPRPGELMIELLSDGDAVTLLLRGELDLGSRPALEQALRRAEGTSGRVVVDLAGLGFIDSTGIHLLVEAHRRAAGRLSLRRGAPDVQRVLELTGVADLFVFEDDHTDSDPGFHRASAPPPNPAIGGRPAASPSG